MFLIKWKGLYASGSPSKNVSSNNLNRTIRLNVAKTEIIEKVVTEHEYFFPLSISLTRS